MTPEKSAIAAGLSAGVLFAVTLFVVDPAHARPPSNMTTVVIAPVAAPRPLSAVVVTSCNLAVALFIQLDATHLLRADPRQSDMFTALDGKMVQSQAGPMTWADAYTLAQTAVLSSHVAIPCTDSDVGT